MMKNRRHKNRNNFQTPHATEKIKKYFKEENITLKSLLNPKFVIKFVGKTRYLHFFVIGVTGVTLNLFLSWFFVEFIFLKSKYLIFNTQFKSSTFGVIIGETVNLIYNFCLHTIVTFRIKKQHKRRFILFVLYSLFTTYLVVFPAILILRNFFEYVFPFINLNFLIGFEYLVAACFVILFFSFFNFIIFKIWLFKDKT